MVLVREDYFVEVSGDRDFVVSEVGEPSPAAVDGVGQERKNFAQGKRHRRRGGMVRRDGGCRGFRFGAVIDFEAASCLSHSVILDEVMVATDDRPRSVSCAQRPTLARRAPTLLLRHISAKRPAPI